LYFLEVEASLILNRTMDLYISSLLLGVLGLAAMAFGGLGHGHGGHAGHGGRGHGGSHAGHSHVHGRSNNSNSFLWSLASPRVLFGFALGFGASGLIAHPLGGVLQLPIAIAGGMAFEFLLMRPLWNFIMRFASEPALTLESAVADEATAVTAFDAEGRGIVSIELDGQVVQVLATLTRDDRVLGTRVRAGQRVRIDDVDAARNQCTVSLL
jgi:hypothetical protein